MFLNTSDYHRLSQTIRARPMNARTLYLHISTSTARLYIRIFLHVTALYSVCLYMYMYRYVCVCIYMYIYGSAKSARVDSTLRLSLV